MAKSSLAFIAPSEQFQVDLGIDESISIEHKQLERYWTSEGFISKNKKKVTFEYLTEIKNNKRLDIKIICTNQIPKSTDQDIQVELLTPSAVNEEQGKIKLNDEAILTWTLQIKASEKLEIPLKYSVMYPKDIRTELDR